MDEETVACEICEKQTYMLGTKRCDRCWELETRIEKGLELSKRIIAALDKHSGTQPTDVQQLKAEIAALTDEYSTIKGTLHDHCRSLIIRLRQLSSV